MPNTTPLDPWIHDFGDGMVVDLDEATHPRDAYDEDEDSDEHPLFVLVHLDGRIT